MHPLGYKITYLPPVSSLYLPSGANISPRALRALGEILAPSGQGYQRDPWIRGPQGSPGSQKIFFGKDIFQLKKKFFFGPGLGPVAPKNAKKRTYEHF